MKFAHLLSIFHGINKSSQKFCQYLANFSSQLNKIFQTFTEFNKKLQEFTKVNEISQKIAQNFLV
jgi:hypothetical protein